VSDTAVFALDLQDELSGPAETAAKSLLDLQAKMDSGKAALREMQATMRTLKGSGAEEAIAALRDQMAAQRAVVQQAAADYIALGGGFGEASAKAIADAEAQEALAAAERDAAAAAQEQAQATGTAADATEEAAGSTGQLLAGARGLLGPMGGLFARANMLSQGLGGVSVAAIAGVAAIAMVVAAVVGAIAKFTQFALVSANAARSMKLMLAAASGSAAGGEALAGAIARIAGEVPQTKAELAQMAQELAKTGLRGKELEDALESAAKKAAGAFGGAKMLDLDVQLAKAKENVSGLFDGVNIEPFLAGLHSVLGLLSESTTTGQGLRAAMKGIFDPVMAALARVAPIAKAFLQGLTIGALQVAVVFLRVKNAISGAFGGGASQVNMMALALKGAQYLVIALAAVFTVIGAVVGAVVFLIVGLFNTVTLVIRGIVTVVGALGDAFSWLGGLASSAWNGITSGLQAAWAAVTGFVGQFTSAGSDLISGLVHGIASGAGAILDALLAPVKAGIAGVKSLLGIHSPSKVFAAIGANTAAGFAEGVDDGADDVAAATKGLVSIPADTPAPKPAAAAAPGAGARSGGNTYVFHISGVKDAESLRDPSFLEQLTATVERVTQASGAPLHA
jgi:hypothetical protein